MREIVVWVLPSNGYDTVPTFREHLAAYLREHPALSVFAKVRTQTSLWEDLFRLIKNPHQGPRPDIVQIPAYWTSTLSHLGLLQDLRELDSRLDLRQWFPPVQDCCRLEGTERIYSLPWWMELRALFYRRDALEEIGRGSGDLANWDGFRDTCRALCEAGFKQPVANPNPRESVAMVDLAPSVWSQGGRFFSADGSRSLFQREDACRAIGSYFELIDEGWMPLKGQSGPSPKNLFEGGCVFEFSGRFPRPPDTRRKRRVDDKIGVVPFPTGGRGASTMIQTSNLAMLRDVEGPREVYGVLRELVRDAPAAAFARSIGALPAIEKELAKRLGEYPEVNDVFRKAMGSMRTFRNLRVLGTLEKVFNRSLERLVSDVIHNDYSYDVMRRELIHAAAEIDHVLSLYG